MATRRICFAIAVLLVFSQLSWAGTNVFTVSPSGDTSGQTDWNNIMAAFQQAVAAGPGSTVQFTLGDFYLHRPIEVANFSGTVKGAGKGLTNLRTAPGVLFGILEPPLVPFPAFMALYLDATWPLEQEASITISSLTFRIEGPSQSWGSHDPANRFNNMNVVDVRGRQTGVADFELTRLNVTFEHLEAIGVAGPEYLVFGYSILNCFQVWGGDVHEIDPATGVIFFRWVKPIAGKFTWRDIYFENAAFSLAAVGAKDSTITFGGSPKDRIVGRNGYDAVDLMDISNSTVEVSYVETYNRSGVFLMQGAYAVWGNDLGELVPETMPDLSKFVFSHNTIRKSAGSFYAGFELWDVAGEVGVKTIEAVISNNKVVSEQAYEPFGPVFSYFARDVSVTNNIISGSGLAGVWVGSFGTPDTGWTLLGNNLQNFNADLAHIYLGPATSNCTVVGGNNKTGVFDEGTGNILVGVNNRQGNPPGQEIKEALRRKREMLKTLRMP